MMNDPLRYQSFELAKSIVGCYKEIVEEKKEFVMSRQLLRSGTAVGALIRESKNAESKPDFIHKMAIAQKECDETLFWLELLYETGYIKNENFEILHGKANGLLRMLRSSILTTKAKLKK